VRARLYSRTALAAFGGLSSHELRAKTRKKRATRGGDDGLMAEQTVSDQEARKHRICSLAACAARAARRGPLPHRRAPAMLSPFSAMLNDLDWKRRRQARAHRRWRWKISLA